jgi:hypothetical protein
MIAFANLVSASNQTQVRATLVSLLVGMGIPADQWRVGGPLSSILTACSYILATASLLIAQAIGSGFLGIAKGPWLDLLGQYVFGVTRPPAVAAAGQLTFVNAGGGVYPVAAFAGSFRDSTTGQYYTNTAPFTVNPTSTLSGVNFQALQAGSASSATPGAIDTIVSPPMAGVTVSNPLAVAGADALDDATYTILCQSKLGALSVRGVRTAYAYAILTALDSVTQAPVYPVEVNRYLVSASSHTGTVSVILASPSGPASGTAIAGVAANIEAIARPDTVTVTTTSATTVTYAPTVTVWCALPPGVTAAQAQAACAASVATVLANYRIGGVLASDDTQSNFQGLFGGSVAGACAQAIAALGGTYYSSQGAPDLALTPGLVATNGVSVLVRVLSTGVMAS